MRRVGTFLALGLLVGACFLVRSGGPWNIPASPVERPRAGVGVDRLPVARASDAHRLAERIAAPIYLHPGSGGLLLRDRNVSVRFEPSALAFAGLVWSPAGARKVTPEATGPLPARIHHLVGAASDWQTDLPTYEAVRYPAVFPGVDLRIEARPHGVEYSLALEPGSDPSVLRFQFEGAREVRVVEGGSALEVTTDRGTLREGGLFCYQDGASGRREVAARYVSTGTLDYSIELGEFDRALPLVVDPTIDWSTFIGGNVRAAGGNAYDFGQDVAVDSQGNVYVTGLATSYDFPATGGMTGRPPGMMDSFVTKLDPTGSQVIWSTYLGGTRDDVARALAVDGAGNVVVCGSTASFDFPTVNAVQGTHGGSSENAFLAKLNASGSQLLWSTYFGGSGGDHGRGVAIDGAGNVTLVGTASSSNFPVTAAFTLKFPGADGFVARFSASGALAWSSCLGGAQGDDAMSVAVDSDGSVYVGGGTLSNDFPATPGAFQTTRNGIPGTADAFLTKINPAAPALVWSTFLGGGMNDSLRHVATNKQGSVFVVGSTNSPDFPTDHPFQPALAGGDDAFVARFSGAGAMSWSTYLGGAGADVGSSIAVDGSTVYVTGTTNSPELGSRGVFDPTKGVGNDAFVARMSLNGILSWFNYLGGSGDDEGHGVAIDPQGNAVVAGGTSSADFPVVSGFQSSGGGSGYDAFVSKVRRSGSQLTWSTYLGGATGPGDDFAHELAVDAAGNVIVTGISFATDFSPDGNGDVFILKVSPAGTLLWSTFLGGSNTDDARGLVLDASGDVYVSGRTSSPDFPIVGGFSTGSAFSDVFVAKVSSSGSALLWSGTFGGSSSESGYALALDSSGKVYVTGITNSPDFGAHGTGAFDVFVAKIDLSSSSLIWTTVLGGFGGNSEGQGIALDAAGRVYVAGGTFASDFPGPARTPPVSPDAFLLQLDSGTGTHLWTRFLGGSDWETALGVALDGSGIAYVSGVTESSDFPLFNPIDATFQGVSQAFVTAIDSTGGLMWSTYLGGAVTSAGTGVAVDATGQVYVVGNTRSPDFPGTPVSTRGAVDIFVAKIDPSGPSLSWATVFGGSQDEEPWSLAVSPDGSLYVTGQTRSPDFPAAGGFDSSMGGLFDGFLLRLLQN